MGRQKDSRSRRRRERRDTLAASTELAVWNEFIVARTLLRPENYTPSVELYALATAGQYDTPRTQFSAFAMSFAMSVALIYFFAQSYVESGLSSGGMEG
ncbi:binding-protein-dependent transport system inner membrane protein [Natrialba asiatica DSM 12278]|uniref:Binding-protein-dependent transport system inner membrane protein n=1 Tax=Natrialba asiatica (strain ATCC 700177 / DSM 12278 / JCM 9576 / FERM P-10747 / NBRC 102637 / 172P1) TaxID=29540 RepID=M0AVH1_NATA1|nr:hypothetical protein [Natrialba asiatica]ELZ01948.1 binding-protein-dependent transport system inner membrane protein [Natrialba asiatica DSM 12278]